MTAPESCPMMPSSNLMPFTALIEAALRLARLPGEAEEVLEPSLPRVTGCDAAGMPNGSVRTHGDRCGFPVPA